MLLHFPTTGARVHCGVGGTTNCFNILANGNVEITNLGNPPTGFALIPGVLQASKVGATDLGGYAAPVPEPEARAMLVAGLGMLGLVARRRKVTA